MAELLDGNIARITNNVLPEFFGTDGNDIERARVSIKFDDGKRARILAMLGVMLADGPAVKEMLSAKEHAGHKPCC